MGDGSPRRDGAVRLWWVTSYPLAVQILQDRCFHPLQQHPSPGWAEAALGPGVIGRLSPVIASSAEDLLNQPPAGERVDLVSRFARPFPVMAVAALLGVPPADRARFRSWAAAVVHPRPAVLPDTASTSEEDGLRALKEYLFRLAAERVHAAPILPDAEGAHSTGSLDQPMDLGAGRD